MIKIIKNRIKCNHCGDIITSEYVHDFKTCTCGTVSVDGGRDYMKRSYKNSRADYEDLSIYEEVDDEELKKLESLEIKINDEEQIKKLMEYINDKMKNKGDLHDLYRWPN